MKTTRECFIALEKKNETIRKIIEDSYMAGQADSGVNPSYSDAQRYCNELIKAIKNSHPQTMHGALDAALIIVQDVAHNNNNTEYTEKDNERKNRI